jgi:hypothetical protein
MMVEKYDWRTLGAVHTPGEQHTEESEFPPFVNQTVGGAPTFDGELSWGLQH